MNLGTLEPRLHSLLRRPNVNNQTQQYQQLVNSSSPIGTMIPTPGMSHSGNSTMAVTSTVDTSMISAGGSNSIAPTTVNTGSLLPTGAGGLHSSSFNRLDGNRKSYNPFVIDTCLAVFATVSQSLLLQALCLMDISSLLPIFPSVLVGTCHQWVLKQLQAK